MELPFKGNKTVTIPILFEDENVIAVNKPEGVTSIPGSEKGKETLIELVSKLYTDKVFVVHRLDKDVSGVMLFAKNASTHKSLNDQFANHTIKKTYMALVHGVIDKQEGWINKPIHQFGSGRMGVDELRGKPSITGYEVIERLPEHTLVKAFPKTGRKHQIRVHFYALGNPIVGDTRYGNPLVKKTFPRMMLHAHSITFLLPSGEEKTVESTLPDSFVEVLNSLKE